MGGTNLLCQLFVGAPAVGEIDRAILRGSTQQVALLLLFCKCANQCQQYYFVGAVAIVEVFLQFGQMLF